MNSPNQGIEHRRTVHGGDNSALSVEVSAVRFNSDGSVTGGIDPHETIEGTGFGVYIRNPLAFHVEDFGPESVDPNRRVTLAEAKAAAFTYAEALGDHLGCHVDSALVHPKIEAERREAYESSMIAEAEAILRGNGFSDELVGGGDVILSRYTGSPVYVWASGSEGSGKPWARDFCVCVYAQDADGQVTGEALLDLRRSDDERDGLFLVDAIRMAIGAAEAVHAALANMPTAPSFPGGEGALMEIAAAAAAEAKEPDAFFVEPDGFRFWAEVCQGFSVYAPDERGAVILSDATGQDKAQTVSWMVSAFSGRFVFDTDIDAPKSTLQELCRFTMAGPLGLESAIAAARAMVDALPLPAAPVDDRRFSIDGLSLGDLGLIGAALEIISPDDEAASERAEELARLVGGLIDRSADNG